MVLPGGSYATSKALMARLVTPVGMLVTVALLALYGAFGIWTAISEHSWLSGLAGAIAIIACIGAARLLAWSRFLVYLLAVIFIGTWALSLYSAAQVGYFTLFSPLEIALALAPGGLLVALSCFSAYIVFRQFRVSAGTR
jgi:nicotinamide riboside transporter PnuC